jgi:hypothetical protein
VRKAKRAPKNAKSEREREGGKIKSHSMLGFFSTPFNVRYRVLSLSYYREFFRDKGLIWQGRENSPSLSSLFSKTINFKTF